MDVETKCSMGEQRTVWISQRNCWWCRKYAILYNKEEIKNSEDNYLRDSSREDKDENLNVLK